MFPDTKHYGLATHVDRATGKVSAFKVWDVAPVRKEERRLRKIIDGMIRSAPPEERPKPSLAWTKTIVENLGAKRGKPTQLAGGDPGTLTFAMDFTGQMLPHASAMAAG